MRNTNYIKTDERLFFFMLGAVSYLALQRFYLKFGMELTAIVTISALIALQILIWFYQLKEKRNKKDKSY